MLCLEGHKLQQPQTTTGGQLEIEINKSVLPTPLTAEISMGFMLIYNKIPTIDFYSVHGTFKFHH
jgi:hypothetical protein